MQELVERWAVISVMTERGRVLRSPRSLMLAEDMVVLPVDGVALAALVVVV